MSNISNWTQEEKFHILLHKHLSDKNKPTLFTFEKEKVLRLIHLAK